MVLYIARPLATPHSTREAAFVKELAEYERSGDQVTATVESIAASMFSRDTL